MKSHGKLSIAYLGKQAGIGPERSKSALSSSPSIISAPTAVTVRNRSRCIRARTAGTNCLASWLAIYSKPSGSSAPSLEPGISTSS